MSGIAPAITTLQALRDGKTLDQLALALHDGINAVEAFRKPAKITLEITIAPFGTKGVSGMVTMTAEVSAKLPKPDPEETPFYVDMNGNPTTHQERTRQMGLNIAAAPLREDTGT
jgi:hypothetical protein